MAKRKTEPPLLPGDIVQVTEATHPLYTHLLIVETVRKNWISAMRQSPTTVAGRLAVGLFPERLRRNTFFRVGTAYLLTAEIAKARTAAEETERLLAAERG